jgi:hypothetical protein
MSTMRFLAAAACAASLCQLTSCGGGGGKVEAVNPTVAEMDNLDVQWGLSPRRSRGAPRRVYRYQPGSSGAALPPRETVDAPPPATLSTEPPAARADINSLR